MPLDQALVGIDESVIDHFAPLLVEGRYLPLLLEVSPVLVAPGGDRDYFSHEQVDTWGVDQFFGLPQDPRCFYYRTFETVVDAESHLYEFVVPMVPPAWNDRDRVQHHRDRIAQGAVPSAVAVTTLDRCGPATQRPVPDQHEHWGLTHFLLDGHHKFEAAAAAGAPLVLLSLVAIDDSLATSHDIDRLPELRHRPRSARPASAAP